MQWTGARTIESRGLALLLAAAMAGSALLVLAVTGDPLTAAAAAAVFLALPLAQRGVDLRTALYGYLAVLLLVPGRAYIIPAASWFDLTPQRAVLFAVILLWAGLLLVDPETRLHASGFGPQLFALSSVAFLSLLVNAQALAEEGRLESGLKAMASLVSFILAFLLAASIGSDSAAVTKLFRWIVVLGAVLSVFAILERVTAFNLFYHLEDFLPLLERNPTFYLDKLPLARGGGLRVFGSSDHPIAFGALLTMIWPFSLHFVSVARGRARYAYLAASVAILGATLLTVSRTAVAGLAVAFFILVVKMPRYRVALLSSAVALAVSAGLILPGVVSGLASTMSPSYLIEKEFSTSQVNKTASGEWIYMGRGFAYAKAARETQRRPLLGMGYDMLEPERFFYTDNQFEKLLVEMGALGLAAFTWLTFSLIARFWRCASAASEDLSGLFAAIAAGCAAFTVMSLGYDTLGFPQPALLFFVIGGLGAGLARVCTCDRLSGT